MNKSVQIFTDGCCLGNPGRGGYGIIMVYKDHSKELSSGYALTTNNRMELMACIEALAALKEPCAATITTDSQYVVNAVNQGWAAQWKAKGWRRSGNKPAENPDLWTRLLDLTEQHEAKFVWVRGHNGHPENERCDLLAKAAAEGSDIQDDLGYVAK